MRAILSKFNGFKENPRTRWTVLLTLGVAGAAMTLILLGFSFPGSSNGEESLGVETRGTGAARTMKGYEQGDVVDDPELAAGIEAAEQERMEQERRQAVESGEAPIVVSQLRPGRSSPGSSQPEEARERLTVRDTRPGDPSDSADDDSGSDADSEGNSDQDPDESGSSDDEMSAAERWNQRLQESRNREPGLSTDLHGPAQGPDDLSDDADPEAVAKARAEQARAEAELERRRARREEQQRQRERASAYMDQLAAQSSTESRNSRIGSAFRVSEPRAYESEEPEPEDPGSEEEEYGNGGKANIPAWTILAGSLSTGINTDRGNDVTVRIEGGPLDGAIIGGRVALMRDGGHIAMNSMSWEGRHFEVSAVAVDLSNDAIAGIEGEIDRHFWKRWGGFAAASLVASYSDMLQLSGQVAQTGGDGETTTTRPDFTREELFLGAAGGAASEIASYMMENTLGREPTLTIPSGTLVGILFEEPLKHPALPDRIGAYALQ